MCGLGGTAAGPSWPNSRAKGRCWPSVLSIVLSISPPPPLSPPLSPSISLSLSRALSLSPSPSLSLTLSLSHSIQSRLKPVYGLTGQLRVRRGLLLGSTAPPQHGSPSRAASGHRPRATEPQHRESPGTACAIAPGGAGPQHGSRPVRGQEACRDPLSAFHLSHQKGRGAHLSAHLA